MRVISGVIIIWTLVSLIVIVLWRVILGPQSHDEILQSLHDEIVSLSKRNHLLSEKHKDDNE
jgi:multisubunit Na+/H+ antiporter MnhF subunit